MTEPDFLQLAQTYLPPYLKASERRELFEGLRNFRELPTHYFDRPDLAGAVLQGDAWRGFVVLDFGTGTRREVAGLVLSNSCDVDFENPRALPANVVFAPLIRLTRYSELLAAAGLSRNRIDSILGAIRRQEKTEIFYLPEKRGALEESLVVLSDVHSQPLDAFRAARPRKLIRLNQVFFYVFLIKMSIHFTRLGEAVSRFA